MQAQGHPHSGLAMAVPQLTAPMNETMQAA
jgi:hypothetical protein